jgi:hypothetical protein
MNYMNIDRVLGLFVCVFLLLFILFESFPEGFSKLVSPVHLG